MQFSPRMSSAPAVFSSGGDIEQALPAPSSVRTTSNTSIPLSTAPSVALSTAHSTTNRLSPIGETLENIPPRPGRAQREHSECQSFSVLTGCVLASSGASLVTGAVMLGVGIKRTLDFQSSASFKLDAYASEKYLPYFMAGVFFTVTASFGLTVAACLHYKFRGAT